MVENPTTASARDDAPEKRVAPGGPSSALGGHLRTFAAGILMGVANIIPGVSGGTMILALGLYERFVDSIADITRFKFRLSSFVFLGILGGAAILAIFSSVGFINWGLTNHQHIMFAVFIGLTLGGVPLIWKEIQPIGPASLGGAAGGFALMIFTSFMLTDLDLPANFAFLFVGGIIGSAAMVLPGISGSYLLLALGLYFPITEGISEFKDALQAVDIDAMMKPALGVIMPVGLGVLTGIAGLTNLLKAALTRFHALTMGGLLGLLLGSVFFLYPFKEPSHKDPFESAAPLTPANIAIVLFCILAGFGVTLALSRLGRSTRDAARESDSRK